MASKSSLARVANTMGAFVEAVPQVMATMETTPVREILVLATMVVGVKDQALNPPPAIVHPRGLRHPPRARTNKGKLMRSERNSKPSLTLSAHRTMGGVPGNRGF